MQYDLITNVVFLTQSAFSQKIKFESVNLKTIMKLAKFEFSVYACG